MNDLKKRILSISYKYKLSHLGSCLTAVDIIDEIYKIKKKDEPFILSAGHAHLAHAVVMEYHGIIKDAEKNIENHGIHCERAGGCDVSTGSLGQGISISVGMALADRSKMCYCLISDGECSEGSIWEALRIMNEQKLKNLKIYININKWGAYQNIDGGELVSRLAWFTFNNPIEIVQTKVEQFPFLKGQDAHYHVMTKEEYESTEETEL